MIKFLHIADIHLGCRRYNLEERTQDFFRAWNDVIERYVLPNNLDFVLIAGDYFNSRKVDPQAMNHAMIGLQVLRDAGTPVLAIEGNHDMHDAVSNFSWMRSLSQWGLLKLLEPSRDEEGRMELVPWNEEGRTGSFIDVAGARIFGSHWYGASTDAALPLLSDALRRARHDGLFNILMLHTDVEGQTNRPIPALPVAKLKELQQLVNYVALGHTHKRFDLDNWAFNPGSLEACSIDEYKEERGAFLVQVDEDHHVTAEHLRDYVQRPFQRLSFDVSGAADPGAVFAGVMEITGREARQHDAATGRPEPIIEITLRGQLGFKNSLLDIAGMREEAKSRTGALHVIIRNQSVPVEYAVAAGLDAQAPRGERERRIIEDLIARDNRYKDRASEIAELVIESKRLALTNEAPDKILDLISRKLDHQTGGSEHKRETVNEAEGPLAATALNAIERNALTAVMSNE